MVGAGGRDVGAREEDVCPRPAGEEEEPALKMTKPRQDQRNGKTENDGELLKHANARSQNFKKRQQDQQEHKHQSNTRKEKKAEDSVKAVQALAL